MHRCSLQMCSTPKAKLQELWCVRRPGTRQCPQCTPKPQPAPQLKILSLSPHYKLEKGRLLVASKQKSTKYNNHHHTKKNPKLWNQLQVRVPFLSGLKQDNEADKNQTRFFRSTVVFACFWKTTVLSAETRFYWLALQNRTIVSQWHFSISRTIPNNNIFGENLSFAHLGQRIMSNYWQLISQRRPHDLINILRAKIKHKQNYLTFSNHCKY